MKTIGLIGGMSWESTVTYYKEINELVKRRLGPPHSAKILLCSVDFAEIEKLALSGRWEETGELLKSIALTLEEAGSGMILLCTNTMHKMADRITSVVSVPFIHIADPTAAAIKERGLKKVGLLGTKFTMEEDFYSNRLKAQGLDVVIPAKEQRELIHRVIFEELCNGIASPASKSQFKDIIAGLKNQGAEGVVLGCTEIGMLISAADSVLPTFDTTLLHAKAAVDLALG